MHLDSIQLLSSCSSRLPQIFASALLTQSDKPVVGPLYKSGGADSQKLSVATKFKVYIPSIFSKSNMFAKKDAITRRHIRSQLKHRASCLSSPCLLAKKVVHRWLLCIESSSISRLVWLVSYAYCLYPNSDKKKEMPFLVSLCCIRLLIYSATWTHSQGQLFQLMQRLENTTPHFIRCIKPNNMQSPGMYEQGLVLQQLRCCGVLEVVRISRSGFPTRMTHQKFARR